MIKIKKNIRRYDVQNRLILKEEKREVNKRIKIFGVKS